MVPHIDTIYNKYKDQVAFVFRNFPISGHANARAASAAAEAAGKQGYFWEMYESLYTNRNSWIEKTGEARTSTLAELFAGVAKDGDINQFRADLSNEEITKKIDFDYELGKNYDHVTATPSIHVNGEWVDITDIKTFDDVEQAVCDKIEEALKNQK
jgi:protein-disulfide isomerase